MVACGGFFFVRIPPKQLSQASSHDGYSFCDRLCVQCHSWHVCADAAGALCSPGRANHPGRPLAQFISVLQAQLQARGMDLLSAYNAAILEVIHLVQQQGYALALQDAFRLTLWTLFPALLAMLLLPAGLRKAPPRTKETKGELVAEGFRKESLPLMQHALCLCAPGIPTCCPGAPAPGWASLVPFFSLESYRCGELLILDKVDVRQAFGKIVTYSPARIGAYSPHKVKDRFPGEITFKQSLYRLRRLCPRGFYVDKCS
jgi:hypothetical protein